MEKLLLVIDAQRDFIEGSLSVAGAPKMMDHLAEYVRQHDGDYCLKVFTQDWHPYNHCSFKVNGGIWPIHCLQHSEGAGIHQPLLEAAYATKGETVVLTKGNNPAVEEYSIFDNSTSAETLKSLIKTHNIGEIDTCGLAREYCVKESVNGIINTFGPEYVVLLDRFIGSISDEHALDAIINSYHLTVKP